MTALHSIPYDQAVSRGAGAPAHPHRAREVARKLYEALIGSPMYSLSYGLPCLIKRKMKYPAREMERGL